MMVAFVMIFLASLHLCGATRLPPEWSANIVQLCATFDDSQPPPPIVYRAHYLQSLHENMRHPIMYLFPPVILWSPLEQFRALHINITCPKCAMTGQNDDGSLHATGWRNGA